MPSPALTRLAPAKLNLFLHITGRRADGYHELQTLFQLLDYGDELSFDPLPNGELRPARRRPYRQRYAFGRQSNTAGCGAAAPRS
jgi:hypothetical protein